MSQASPPQSQGPAQTAALGTLTTSRTEDPAKSVLMLEFRPEPTPAPIERKPSKPDDAVALLLESARASLSVDPDGAVIVYAIHIVRARSEKVMHGSVALDNILGTDMLSTASETVDTLVQTNLVGRLKREMDRLIREKGTAAPSAARARPEPQRLLPGRSLDMPEDPNTPPGG